MLHRLPFDPHFEGWKKAAKLALSLEWKPTEILWISTAEAQNEFELESDLFSSPALTTFRISREFLFLAESASCHTHPQRWSTLYRALWRWTHGENHLLRLKTDPDVAYLNHLQKQVGREIHKMRAFVRFRKLTLENQPWYIAWFEPQFTVLEKNIPFFTQRFPNMNWAILSPYQTLTWDQRRIHIGPGCAKPPDFPDEAEELWIQYYESIFNPARVKTKAMKKEFPVYYWKNLPEAKSIPFLIQKSSARVQEMFQRR